MDHSNSTRASSDDATSSDSGRSARSEFLDDALTGLRRRPRSLPCKYLYDERGSDLFEQICDTDEYYVTRADLALHRTHLDDIARTVGPGAHLIEFGSGAGIKIRLLLRACKPVRAYTPIEISGEALDASVVQLAAEFPDLELRPVQADYTQPLPDDLKQLDPPARRRVVYFPGSTISNFDHSAAGEFLRRMAAIAAPDGGVLIGVDLVKDESRLIAAYDDHAGVTAAFNTNLLERMRQELGAVIERDVFRHEARYNRDQDRIEMHLVADRATVIELDGQRFEFDAGESIHTENSHKYTIEGFQALARSAGLEPIRTWTDPDELFSMHYLEPARNADG